MAPTQAGRVVKFVLAFAIGCCGQASDLIEPFPFSAVKLTPNSDFDKALSLNMEYMLSLDEDDLLRTFRENARLPAPGMPYSGSWEDSGCEVRGQFMGHYLSALAFLANHTGKLFAVALQHPCMLTPLLSDSAAYQQTSVLVMQATEKYCHAPFSSHKNCTRCSWHLGLGTCLPSLQSTLSACNCSSLCGHPSTW